MPEWLWFNKTGAKAAFMDPRFKKAGFGVEANTDNAQNFFADELMMLETQESPVPLQVPNRSLLLSITYQNNYNFIFRFPADNSRGDWRQFVGASR